MADANSLERHLDVIQQKIERTFNQVNANAAALSTGLDGTSAEVTLAQADMDEVRKALGIVEG